MWILRGPSTILILHSWIPCMTMSLLVGWIRLFNTWMSRIIFLRRKSSQLILLWVNYRVFHRRLREISIFRKMSSSGVRTALCQTYVFFEQTIVHVACLPTAQTCRLPPATIYIFVINYECIYHLHKYWKPGKPYTLFIHMEYKNINSVKYHRIAVFV